MTHSTTLKLIDFLKKASTGESRFMLRWYFLNDKTDTETLDKMCIVSWIGEEAHHPQLLWNALERSKCVFKVLEKLYPYCNFGGSRLRIKTRQLLLKIMHKVVLNWKFVCLAIPWRHMPNLLNPTRILTESNISKKCFKGYIKSIYKCYRTLTLNVNIHSVFLTLNTQFT